MQNAHYFILVFGWVGGGWVVFHHFRILFLLIFLYYCNSINNVRGQHRWLVAFLAACYKLTLILCFSCFILLMFVANKFLLLILLEKILQFHNVPILQYLPVCTFAIS